MTRGQALRHPVEPNGSAREAILDTAEDLFSRRGLDGVSLREINAVAGYSAAALHYHFETRDGLVRALLARAQPPMLAERELAFRRLRALETVTPVDVVDALVRPLAVDMSSNPRGSARRMRFLSRLYFDRSPYMHGVFEDSLALFLPFLRRALPDVDDATIRQRWVFAVELAQHALGHVAEMAQAADSSAALEPRALECYVRDLVQFIVGGLCKEHRITWRPSTTP